MAYLESVSRQSVRSSLPVRLGRVVLVIVVLAAALAGGVYAWFRAAERAAMPTLDGTVSASGAARRGDGGAG